MVESRRGWTYPILRSAYQYAGLATVSFRNRRSLASRPLTTEPEGSCSLAANETAHRPLASSGPNLSSLSFVSSARHHLRQEPDAGNPLVRNLCGGYGAIRIPTATGSQHSTNDAAFKGIFRTS